MIKSYTHRLYSLLLSIIYDYRENDALVVLIVKASMIYVSIIKMSYGNPIM